MLPARQVGSQQGPEGLRQASRGCRGYGAAPALNPEAHAHISSRADRHAGSCLLEPQLGGRGFPARGQEAPAKAWHFQGLRDFSRITSESLVPLCSPSPHSGFGVPPASLLGATVRKRGLRRINERKVRQRRTPGSLPARRWGKDSLVEAWRALLSLQTLQRNLLTSRAHRGTIFLR